MSEQECPMCKAGVCSVHQLVDSAALHAAEERCRQLANEIKRLQGEPRQPVEQETDEAEQGLQELAASVCVLTDSERRKLNATLLAKSGRWIADMGNQHGYREMAGKCAALEQERDAAIAREDRLVVTLAKAERTIETLEQDAGRVWKEFHIEGEETAYEAASRLNAAAARLSEELSALRAEKDKTAANNATLRHMNDELQIEVAGLKEKLEALRAKEAPGDIWNRAVRAQAYSDDKHRDKNSWPLLAYQPPQPEPSRCTPCKGSRFVEDGPNHRSPCHMCLNTDGCVCGKLATGEVTFCAVHSCGVASAECPEHGGRKTP